LRQSNTKELCRNNEEVVEAVTKLVTTAHKKHLDGWRPVCDMEEVEYGYDEEANNPPIGGNQ